MANFDITQIKGVIPAMLTFFDENEEVDETRTRNMTEFLIHAGVNGLYLTGSTGACFTMTAEERCKVVDIVVDQVAGRIPVIVHVGDIGTKKSIELAKHAEKAGADAISSVPPFYWKFNGDSIYHYYKDIAQATSLPMIVYNIQLAGIMDKNQLLRLAEIPNVKGMKYTARTNDEMGALKRTLGKDFMIYSGCDEMAFSGLSFGADGIIGSFYNVIPELYLNLYQATIAGETAKAIELQAIADDFIFAALEYDFIAAFYNMLSWRGIDAGRCRRPFHTYDDSQLEGLKAKIREIQERTQCPTLRMFEV